MNDDRYFADTNVLLYAVNSRDPEKAGRALAWMVYLWENGSGRLSWQVIHEFYANAVRKFARTTAEARRDAYVFKAWRPGPVSMEIIERSWYWTDQAQVTYWEGLILASAEEEGCRWLLSEDFQHGRKYGTVEVINPFQVAPPDVPADVRH